MFANLTHNFRFAARTLWRNRGFAASAILILTLGMAASTGLFAVLDALVLLTVPVVGADRIAPVRLVALGRRPEMAMVNADHRVSVADIRMVLRAGAHADGATIHAEFSLPFYREASRDNTTFESLFGFKELGRITALVDPIVVLCHDKGIVEAR